MAHQTILLIDYEPRSIERFRQPLTDAGYTVEVATDGITGIEAFHRLNPDMVLVEAMIPKRHGFEVCQELKRTPHGRRTPVLITTGVYKGRKYRTQALHIYGCDEYIEKPIAPEQLLAVVGKFFSGPASGSAPEPRPSAPVEAPTVTAPDAIARHATPAKPESPPARSGPPKPSVGSSIVNDFTEEEIMARLDAILPGGEIAQAAPIEAPIASSPILESTVNEASVEEAPIAVVTTPELPVEPLASNASPEEPQDPFARMQAELTAELGSMSGSLALEQAPVFDALPQDFPQQPAPVVPSVLETLPTSDEPSTSPESIPLSTPGGPASPVETPGQLVTFDARRSRRKKHGKKGGHERGTVATPKSTPTVMAPRTTPAAELLDSGTHAAKREASSRPAGSHVQAGVVGTPAPKRFPLWVLVVLLLGGLAIAYFMLIQPRLSEPDAARTETRETVARGVPPEPEAAPEAPTAATADRRDLVLNAIEPLAAPSSAPPPSANPAPAKATATVTPNPDSSETSTSGKRVTQGPAPATKISAWRENVPVTVPSAPPAAEEGVAGVESVIESPATAPEQAVVPGTLLDAGEVDAAPVSLSRKLPTYSMQARQLRVQGTVVMRVLVNERGTVDEVVIVNGVPGADVNDAAMRAAKAWTYQPATKAGVPVKVWKVEQVTFKM